jgi:DNA-binding transcriptional LysR family regulator
MRLQQFDLNLLVAFHALLEEHSVTRAAERLNMSQPAMSAALRRLRESFNDEILIPHGKKMVPTSHAQGLAPLVTQALINMQALLSSSMVFDPATSQRVFRIAASDYITVVLIAPVIADLETTTPGVRVEVVPTSSESITSLERGTLDFILTPERFLAPNHPKHLLFEERHVVVGWNQNPIFNKPLTEEVFNAAGHIAVEISGQLAFVEGLLKERGDHRRIEVVASSFTIVPFMLPGTHRIALMHERLAKVMLDKFPLAIAPVPFELPSMSEMIQYHGARSHDGGLNWLLGKLLARAAMSA